MKLKMKTHGLYEWKIDKEDDSSLTEQVYRIFRKEIVSGRWSEGERMPSFNDLFASTKLSRYPLITALNRLEDEGFIKKIKQKGIFLVSMRPKGVILGNVGIVVDSGSFESRGSQSTLTKGFGLWNIPTLQSFVEGLGYKSEILSIRPSSADSKATRKFYSVFDIDGVISFAPRESLALLNMDKSIPIVFLGVDDVLSNPCVTGDPHRAMYELTLFLLKSGHREIAVFASQENDSYFLDIVRDGYEKAIAAAGFNCVSKDYFNVGKAKSSDMLGIKTFFEANKSATAVVSLGVSLSHKIVEYADMVGMRIPEDVSLASLQTGDLRGDAAKAITGAYYDWNSIMRTCTDILFREVEYDIDNISRISHKPLLEKGVTVATMRN